MVNTHRVIIIFLCFLPSYAYSQAAEVGTIDLAGWVKSADGTYSRAFSDGNGTRSTAGNTLTSTAIATVNTSKGLVPFEITKTGSFDVPRIGKSIAKVAIASGPVGLLTATVSLICDLTTICNDAGKWMMQGSSQPGDTIPSSTSGTWYTTNNLAFSTAGAAADWQCANNVAGGGGTLISIKRTAQPVYFDVSCKRTSDNATVYAGAIRNFAGVPATQSQEATQSDWDTKESLLNDTRFIQELMEKAADIPISGIPTLTPDQKKRLGLDTVPTKDAQGNVTGREETITEIHAVDAGTSDKPGNVIIKETKTTVRYDTNNTQISTNTSTSYTNQPETLKPTGFEIKFDEIAAATIQNHNVSTTFNANSWGTGTCPPDIEISLTNFTFSIPTSPICNFAEMIKPFVLMLASVLGVYIIAGVRGGSK